ncbi:MAG: alpha/beta hydrolase [Bacteroidetes bacterium]|nr:alpha/beta hydrolase [Bacteroidota bacterium]
MFSRYRRGVLTVLLVSGFILTGYFMIGILQTKMLFPATRDIYRDPGVFGWDFEDVWLHVGEKERSHGWFIPLEGARGVALFSHGNAGNIADRLESIGLLREFGFSVFAYDYGGYGKSSGGPSETRCYQDIRAAWKYLTSDRAISPEQILLFGRSLGGAITIDLATDVQPAAVIVESTFLSVPDVAKAVFPWLPVYWIRQHRMASKEKIGRIQSPLLIVHSKEDTLIPFSHGQKLYELATASPKAFLEIRGDHNNGFVTSIETYRAGWEQFLAPVLPR